MMGAYVWGFGGKCDKQLRQTITTRRQVLVVKRNAGGYPLQVVIPLWFEAAARL
jgi:hypothetical protein